MSCAADCGEEAALSHDTAKMRRRADRSRYPYRMLRLSLAVRLWALRIPIIAREQELAPLLARTAPGRGKPYQGLSVETIVKCVRRAVRRPRLMADRPCLREGLLLHRFLVMAGYSPVLHFGVDRTSIGGPAIRAHCWVTVGEQIFNPPEPTMVEIHRHSAVGAG